MRKKYSPDYKQHAVEMTEVPGATIKAVAADLGINAHMLGKWRKSMIQHGAAEAFPGDGHARDDELMRLRREPGRVKKERDFLKDAAAFFAK